MSMWINTDIGGKQPKVNQRMSKHPEQHPCQRDIDSICPTFSALMNLHKHKWGGGGDLTNHYYYLFIFFFCIFGKLEMFVYSKTTKNNLFVQQVFYEYLSLFVFRTNNPSHQKYLLKLKVPTALSKIFPHK